MTALPSEVEETRDVDGRPALHAFLQDAALREQVEKIAAELGLEPARTERGTLVDAVRRLASVRSPRVLVAEIGDEERVLDRVDELADVCEPNTAVVLVGTRNDVGLFRELVRRGVLDYLVQPVPPPILRRALEDAARGRLPPRTAGRSGRTVVFAGARPGVGCTRLCTAVAHRLATGARRRVALLDLDPVFGDVALSFDREPSRALREVFEDPGRVDGLFVERAAEVVDDILHLFAAEENPADWDIPVAAALPAVVGALRGRYHFLLLDCPPGRPDVLEAAISQGDVAYLVADPTLAALRDLLRILRFAQDVNPSCHVQLVLNRTGLAPKAELSRAEFERGLGRPVDVEVPFDPDFPAAANNGRPPTGLRPAARRAVDRMVERLTGRPLASGLLARLPLLAKLAG